MSFTVIIFMVVKLYMLNIKFQIRSIIFFVFDLVILTLNVGISMASFGHRCIIIHQQWFELRHPVLD